MSVIILVSLLLRILATALSYALLRRLRDRRIWFLTAMLGLMSGRQLWTLVSRYQPDAHVLLDMSAHVDELPALVVSVLALLLVLNLESVILSLDKANDPDRRPARTPLLPSLVIGLVAVAGIGVVAYFAFENSRTAIRDAVAHQNQSLARTVSHVALGDQDPNDPLAEPLAYQRLAEVWARTQPSYLNSAISVLDDQGHDRLAAFSDVAGNDSPRNDSPRNDSPRNDSPRNDSPRNDSPRNDSPRNDSPRNDSPRNDSIVQLHDVIESKTQSHTVRQALQSQRSGSGKFTAADGTQQLVGYHYESTLDALVMVHVPTDVVNTGFQAVVAPWIMSMLLIGGLVLPCSLVLLYHRSRRAGIEVQNSLAALRQSERRFRLLVDTIPHGVQETDLQGRIVFCNPAYAQMHGCTVDDLLGRYIWDFEDTDQQREQLKKYYFELIATTPPPVPYESTTRTVDGRRIDIRVIWAYVRDRQGNLTGFTSIISDVTEAKLASEAVRISEERHRGFVENSTEGIYLCEFDQPIDVDAAEQDQIQCLLRDGYIAVCNDAFARMYGFESGQQMVHRRASQMRTDQIRASKVSLFRNLVRNQYERTEEISEETDPQGRRIVLANSCQGIVEDGRLIRVWGVQRDITERTIAEELLAESEQRYRRLVENSPFYIYEIELDGTLSSMNPAGLKMMGLSSEREVCGLSYLDSVAPDDRQRIGRLLRDAQAGENRQFEFETVDGRVFSSCFAPLTLSDGQTHRVMGITYDITERNRTERLIRSQNEIFESIASGESLQSTLTRLVNCVESLSPDLWASVQILDDSGIRLRHAAGSSMPAEYVAAIDGIEIGPAVGSCGTAAYLGQPVFVDDIANDPRWQMGRELAAKYQLGACWSTPIKDSIGNVLGTFAVYRRDSGPPTANHRRLIEIFTHLAAVSLGRDRNEAALRQSEANFRTIFEQAAVGVALLDSSTGTVLQVNGRYCEILDCTGDSLIGRTWMDLTHPEDLAQDLNNIQRLRSGEIGQFSREKRLRRLDGSFVWIHLTVSPMWQPGEEPTMHIAVVEDVTERKESERSLAFQADVLNRVSDAVVVTDWQGTVTYTNDAARRLFRGDDRLHGQRMFGDLHDNLLISGADSNMIRANLMVSGDWHGEHEFQDDGEVRCVETKLKTFQVPNSEERFLLFVIRDITARHQAEKEIRQHRAMLAHVTRLSTMGELIAGIAHEVKQPLYAIANFTTASSVLLRNLDDTSHAQEAWFSELKEWNEDTRQASHRASEIIQRLRNFARKGEQRRQVIDLNQAVQDSIELVAFEARESGTKVETYLEQSLPEVLANRIQCEQIMVNLLHNAYEAMAGMKGQRRVTVRTRQNDQFVEICVEDNGPGIPPERHGKLFEAFYTTKASGMGLGLAISRTIVEDHGGRLWADVDRRQGAAFHFTLPISHSDQPAANLSLQPQATL